MDVLLLNRSPAVKAEEEADHGGVDIAVKELEGASTIPNEQRSNSSPPEEKYSSVSKQDFAACASERSPSHSTSLPSSSSIDLKGANQDDQLESTRAEMGEVKQENERLKAILARIMKDYQSLQTHFFDTLQQDHDKIKPMEENPVAHGKEADEAEFISLSLGTSSGGHKKEEKKATSSKAKEDDQMKEALSLGLGCKFDRSCTVPTESQMNASRESSLEEQKEEEAGEAWPPSKIVKTLRNGDGEASEQTPVKRARVSVRVRCDAPTMNDGCQWRKYGQKIAKGNPCPRAYYRCTVAPSCPVRKQVQRCAEDMSILTTTYEGTHNHPLPASATAMASTTAAAACMLISGSSTSQPVTTAMAMASSSGGIGFGGIATSYISGPHGLSFSLSDISRQRQFYPPNYNPSVISPSPSCPTITLDLTAPSSPSPSPQITRLSSSFNSTSSYSQAGLTFSSSSEYTNTLPTSWNSTGSLRYVTHPYNNKSQLGFSNLGRTPEEPFHSPLLPTAGGSAPPVGSQPPLTDTIAAATKAITSDPSFQSALAAAITSIVGGAGNQGSAAVAAPGQNLRWWEQLLPASPFTSSPNGNGCASTYLTRSTSSTANAQPADLMLLQPPLAFSSSKSASASPVKTREHSS